MCGISEERGQKQAELVRKAWVSLAGLANFDYVSFGFVLFLNVRATSFLVRLLSHPAFQLAARRQE